MRLVTTLSCSNWHTRNILYIFCHLTHSSSTFSSNFYACNRIPIFYGVALSWKHPYFTHCWDSSYTCSWACSSCWHHSICSMIWRTWICHMYILKATTNAYLVYWNLVETILNQPQLLRSRLPVTHAPNSLWLALTHHYAQPTCSCCLSTGWNLIETENYQQIHYRISSLSQLIITQNRIGVISISLLPSH